MNLASSDSMDVVATADSLGLLVHAYTFGSEVIGRSMPREQVFERLKANGIQGLFTDQVVPYMFD